MSCDDCGIHYGVNVHHEVLVLLESFEELLLGHLFEFFSFRIGYEVPYFRGAFMHIIHGEEIEILKVPAEGAEEHARVSPGESDSRDLLPDELEKAALLLPSLSHVPRVVHVFLEFLRLGNP